MSCKATYIGCMHNVYCNLPPELLAEWLGSFMCYRGNMREERILKSVSTKSWPWRRKLSHHSSWDSNPKPFNHESGALTTELSMLHVHQSACKCLLHTTFTNPKQNTCTHSHTQKIYIYIYTDFTQTIHRVQVKLLTGQVYHKWMKKLLALMHTNIYICIYTPLHATFVSKTVVIKTVHARDNTLESGGGPCFVF